MLEASNLERYFQRDIKNYNNIYWLEKDFGILPKYGYGATIAPKDLNIIDSFTDYNRNIYIMISTSILDFGVILPLQPLFEDMLCEFNVCPMQIVP